jgi:hypothetical protein
MSNEFRHGGYSAATPSGKTREPTDAVTYRERRKGRGLPPRRIGATPVAGFRARGGCRVENPVWTRRSTGPRATHDRSYRTSGTGCDRTCWSAVSGCLGTPDMTGSGGAQTAAQWPYLSVSCREAARCLILNRVAREHRAFSATSDRALRGRRASRDPRSSLFRSCRMRRSFRGTIDETRIRMNRADRLVMASPITEPRPSC